MSVSSLDEHPDRVRIHKLLYFVYTQLWIADIKALEGQSIQTLLSSLLGEAHSIDHFQRRLVQCAEQLNKAETYMRIAQLIVDEVRKQQPHETTGTVEPADPFELRYALIQVLNPLKAKWILFALWHHHTNPQTPLPTSSVRQFSLDELLRKVMHCYPSIATLDSGLKSIESLLTGIEVQETVQLSETLRALLHPYLPAVLPFPSGELEDPEISQDSLCTLLVSPSRSQDFMRPSES